MQSKYSHNPMNPLAIIQGADSWVWEGYCLPKKTIKREKHKRNCLRALIISSLKKMSYSANANLFLVLVPKLFPLHFPSSHSWFPSGAFKARKDFSPLPNQQSRSMKLQIKHFARCKGAASSRGFAGMVPTTGSQAKE